MPTLNLAASKRIREILGETYETEASWRHDLKPTLGWEFEDDDTISVCDCDERCLHGTVVCPAPDFGELVRLMPQLMKDDVVKLWTYVDILTGWYVRAKTPEEGMEEISEHLINILG